MKEYSAEQWRTGTNQRGETFHLWLQELSQKYNMDLNILRAHYEMMVEIYVVRNQTNKDNLHTQDYIQITKDMEKSLDAFQQKKQMREQKRRKKFLSYMFIENRLTLFLILLGLLATLIYVIWWS